MRKVAIARLAGLAALGAAAQHRDRDRREYDVAMRYIGGYRC